MKPFVHAYIKPRYPEKKIHEGKLDGNLLLIIRDKLVGSKDEYVQKLAKEIFDTKKGRKIVKEFLFMRKQNQFKLTNF